MHRVFVQFRDHGASQAGRRVAPLASMWMQAMRGEGKGTDNLGASCSKSETRQLCFAAVSEGA